MRKEDQAVDVNAMKVNKKKNVNVNEVYDVVKIRKIRKMKVGVKC